MRLRQRARLGRGRAESRGARHGRFRPRPNPLTPTSATIFFFPLAEPDPREVRSTMPNYFWRRSRRHPRAVRYRARLFWQELPRASPNCRRRSSRSRLRTTASFAAFFADAVIDRDRRELRENLRQYLWLVAVFCGLVDRFETGCQIRQVKCMIFTSDLLSAEEKHSAFPQ